MIFYVYNNVIIFFNEITSKKIVDIVLKYRYMVKMVGAGAVFFTS
jgi:hypothetical protein